MKRRYRILAAVLAAVLATAALFTGCGSSAPTDSDAKKYVQALLDLMCKGEYDKSVKLADVEEGKETEIRDSIIDEAVNSLGDTQGISEDVRNRFRDYFSQALSKCKYTVGDAVKTDDDGNVGYDVTVSIEPYKIFDGVEEALTATQDELSGDTEKLTSMTEDEIYGIIFDALFSALDKNLENPTYGEAQELVVHYGLLDKEENLYGADEEAGSRIGEMLFSLE